MPVPSSSPFNEVVLQARLTDIGTAGNAYICSPVKGTLKRGYSVIGGAITGTDSTWSIQKNAVAVTGTCTVAVSGSAAGTTDDVVFSGAQVGVNPGDLITVVNGGESTGAATVEFFIVIRT
jgi:hypothetical protein